MRALLAGRPMAMSPSRSAPPSESESEASSLRGFGGGAKEGWRIVMGIVGVVATACGVVVEQGGMMEFRKFKASSIN